MIKDIGLVIIEGEVSDTLNHPGNTEMCFGGAKASCFHHRSKGACTFTHLQSLLKPGPDSELPMQNIYNSQKQS